MNCPACKEPLIVLEYDHVEVDYCVACRGIWLDAGEIELLFGDAAACQALLVGGDLKRARGEAARRCPICSKKMAKGVSSGQPPVTYDQCAAGHGLWFDEGELGAILKHGAAFAHSEIAQFLGAVFAGSQDDPADGGTST